jgi:hypothetical protein
MAAALLEPSSSPANMRRVFSAKVSRQRALFTGLAFFALLIGTWHLFRLHIDTQRTLPEATKKGPLGRYWSVSGDGNLEGLAKWEKPKEIEKIVALIFYGRPASVSILDCYLKVGECGRTLPSKSDIEAA